MNYREFHKLFLYEMPQRMQGGNDFDAQLEMLQENLQYDVPVVQIANNVFKAETPDQITYWCGDKAATNVSLIVDTTIDGNFCKVVLSSKNPTIPSGTKPYASELYLIIKDDVRPKHLGFASDELLSTDGEQLWNGLVRRGNTVSVYDTTQHKYVLSPVTDESELSKFIGGADKKKYIFVLSENIVAQRGIITTFQIMEIKRNAHYPLFEGLT